MELELTIVYRFSEIGDCIRTILPPYEEAHFVFFTHSAGDVLQILWRPFCMRPMHGVHEHSLQCGHIPAKFRWFHSFQFHNFTASHQQYGRASLSVVKKLT